MNTRPIAACGGWRGCRAVAAGVIDSSQTVTIDWSDAGSTDAFIMCVHATDMD